MTFLSKRLQYWNKIKIIFPGIKSGAKRSSFKDNKDDSKVCFICKKPRNFVVGCPNKHKRIVSIRMLYEKGQEKSHVNMGRYGC